MIIVALLSVLISLFLPKWYLAETVLTPPKQDVGFLSGFSQIFANMPVSRALGISGISEEASLCMTILNSRTLMECIVNRFDLMHIYKKRNLEESVKYFRKNIDFLVDDEGAIKIKVLDKNPERAANIANQAVFFLDSIYNYLSVHKAKNSRLFFEERLRENKKDLNEAENNLNQFQKKFGIISLEEQTRATVEIIGTLQAKLLANQYEMKLKESILGPNHQEVYRLHQEINAIQDELQKMRIGSNSVQKEEWIQNKKSYNLLVPLDEMPVLAKNYLNLYKEVQIQNKLSLILIQEYEQAKIQEMKDTPVLQVIDKAIPPYKKFKPKRAVFVMSSIFCSVMLLFIGVYIGSKLEYFTIY